MEITNWDCVPIDTQLSMAWGRPVSPDDVREVSRPPIENVPITIPFETQQRIGNVSQGVPYADEEPLVTVPKTSRVPMLGIFGFTIN